MVVTDNSIDDTPCMHITLANSHVGNKQTRPQRHRTCQMNTNLLQSSCTNWTPTPMGKPTKYKTKLVARWSDDGDGPGQVRRQQSWPAQTAVLGWGTWVQQVSLHTLRAHPRGPGSSAGSGRVTRAYRRLSRYRRQGTVVTTPVRTGWCWPIRTIVFARSGQMACTRVMRTARRRPANVEGRRCGRFPIGIGRGHVGPIGDVCFVFQLIVQLAKLQQETLIR